MLANWNSPRTGRGEFRRCRFESLEDASKKIEAWRPDYNANHPQRALKGVSPNEFAQKGMEPAAESL